MADRPVDVLVAGLRATDEVVQADAARLLGELGRREAVPALVAYVTDCRYYCKTAGIDALARLGDPAVCGDLRRLMADPNVDDDWFWYCRRAVRASAAVALLALGDDSGAAYLKELADTDDDVLLCWYGPAVLRLPDDLTAAREVKALITLDRLAGGGTRRTRHTEPGAVAMKAEALGLIGTPEACRALLELMQFHSRYVRGQAAVSLLGADPGEAHVAAVTAMADSDGADFARVKASVALALAGRCEKVAFLAEAAGSIDDPFDRAVAVEALGIAGDATRADVVASQLAHADAYVRQCALEALERMGAPGARAAAERAAGDASIRVRLQAAKLLAACDGEDA